MKIEQSMKKPMIKMLIALGILFGAIFLWKGIQGFFIKQYLAQNKEPVVTVSAMKANYSSWQDQYSATGSLRAIEGVDVTTEAPGMVREIYFTPGAEVKKDTVLAELDIDPDTAQLHSLQATAALDKITYDRDKAQYAIKAISKQQLDTDEANWKSADAQVGQQQANINEKIIRAPFNGRLGIRDINIGQYVNTGTKVTSLQTYDPIYVDFYVPQEALAQLQVGNPIVLTSVTDSQTSYNGKITTIDSSFDNNSRNVEIEATIANPKEKLVPGMFAPVTVTTGDPKKYLTLPQTAITFNSFGNIAYILKPTDKKDKDNNAIYTATETFVTTGQLRGTQIAVLQGVNAGDLVITSGQLKVKNGSPVIINNTVQPADNPAPTKADETE